MSTTRRAKGEGSLGQRPDGIWHGRLQVDGVRRDVYGRTRKEATHKLAKLQRDAHRNGQLPNPQGRTVGDLLDLWLEVKAPRWRPRTLQDHRDLVRLHLEELRQLPLSKLTPQRMQRLLSQRQAQGKTRTALKLYGVLRAACGLAVAWGWLGHNLCDRVDRPQRKELWTPDQLAAFLRGVEEHWLYPLWLTLLTSGCRLGELLALEWSDVDLGAGAIHITKSAERIAGRRAISPPKTKAGIRTIALPDATVRVLAAQAERCASADPASLVFPGYRGGPLCSTTVEAATRRECARLGLPRLTPHGFRHLHASLLLSEGVPLPEVSQRLGHANPGVTLSIYAHVVQRDEERALDAIGQAIAGRSEPDPSTPAEALALQPLGM